MNSSNNIFQATDCLSQEQLIRYVKGEMTKEEMRVVELHLADCEICFDAVEGLSLVEKSRLEKIQTELHHRIQEQLQMEAQQKVIPFYKKWYSMAAAIAVLFLFSVYLVKQFGQQDRTGLAETQIEQTTITPKLENKVTDETFISDSISNQMPALKNERFEQNSVFEKTVSGNLALESQKQDAEKYQDKIGDDLVKDKTVTEEKNTEVAAAQSAEENVDAGNIAPAVKANDTKDVIAVKESQTISAYELDMRKGNSYNATEYTEKKLKSKRTTAVPAPSATGAATLNETAGSNTNFDFELYDKGLNAFNTKDYTTSEKIFNQLLAKQKDNINSNYYAGVSEYELQHYAASISHLDVVIANKRNSFYESALWYKAQCLLKTDKKTEAKKTLETIVKFKGNYKAQAEELLKEL